MKALIVDKVHPIMMDLFQANQIEVSYQPTISKSTFDDIIKDYHILIIRSKFKITSKEIDLARQLQYIGRVGAGLENIDIDYAQAHHIKCFNSPEGNRDAVGEHAMGLLLTLCNKIHLAHQEIQNGKWNREANWGIELSDKTLGVIGYGNMGQAFSKRAFPFVKKIIAYDKYKTQFSDAYVTERSMETLFEEADIISLHTPLTEETKHLINKQWVNQFKKEIIILNTARGACAKTDDLPELIESGKIKRLGLDVLEYENTNFDQLHQKEDIPALNYLLNSPKVIVTPHVAGWTNEAYLKLSKIMAEKIINDINNSKR